MADTLKQEILEEIAKIPEIDKNEDYRFYSNLSKLISRYAGALRTDYNEERLLYLEKTVLALFRNAKTLDYKTGKMIPLDFEGEEYDMDTVVDAVRVDTYHDGEVDADLDAFKIKNNKLYFHAVSYHLDDWIELNSWNTRKIETIINKTVSSAKSFAQYIWIPDRAFERRDNILKMVIPSGVILIGENAFLQCIRLKEIQIPDSVSKIGKGAFEGCRALESVCIPDGVTEIGDDTFSSCSKLAEVHLPNSITKIGANAFKCCSSLTKLDIPDGVTEIGNGAFVGCFKLSRIPIPGSVTSIGKEAFRNCTSLTEFFIPEGVTEIGDNAFMDCEQLSRLHIPGSVVSIGSNAFAGCHSLDAITVSFDNPVFDSREDCNALIKTETDTLILGCNHTTIPTSVSKIGDAAFCGLTGLTEIHIPEGVTEIGEKAFYGCSSLTKVRIPDSIKLIGKEAFKGCPVIPDGVVEIEDFWFANDGNLTRVDIPASVTRIGENAFDGCINIKEIVVSPENKRYDSRDGCNGIVETASNALVIGCENTIIPGSVKEIGRGAFSGCPGLREIHIPRGVTRIGEGAFYDCVGLCRVLIPDTVVEVGENAFAGCRNLVSLLAPAGLDLKAAKVPRRKDSKIITRYSPEHPPVQSVKSIILPIPNGDSIPVEYEVRIDGKISVTNWPSIQESSSDIGKEDLESALNGYPYDTLPAFILSLLIVLKGGYDRIPDILPWLDCIPDSSLRDKLALILAPVLDTLTELDRDVFVNFYGLGCPRMTLSAIGARLHFTEVRVRQIKEKALRRVRVFTARLVEGQ